MNTLPLRSLFGEPVMTVPHPAGSATESLSLDTELLDCARETSDALRALSHEHRLIILCVLKQGERSVGELESILKLPQPAVSQQLARLRLDDLVHGRRDGRTIHYQLNEEPLLKIFTGLARLLGYSFERLPDELLPTILVKSSDGGAGSDPTPERLDAENTPHPISGESRMAG